MYMEIPAVCTGMEHRVLVMDRAGGGPTKPVLGRHAGLAVSGPLPPAGPCLNLDKAPVRAYRCWTGQARVGE